MSGRRRQRGLAVVELAFLLLLLLALVFGATEFGRAIYYYDTLVKSSRTAARYLTYSNPWQHPEVVAQARNLALCGSTENCGTTRVVPGLEARHIQVALPRSADPLPSGAVQDPDPTRPLTNIEVRDTANNIVGRGNAVRVTIGPDGQNLYRFQFLAPFVTDAAQIDFGAISSTFLRFE